MTRPVLLFVLLTALTALPTRAQDELRLYVSLGGAVPFAPSTDGLFVSPSDLGDLYNVGFEASVGVGWPLAAGFELVGWGSYDTFSLSTDDINKQVLVSPTARPTVDGGNFNILAGGLSLRYNFDSEARFGTYMLGSVGVFSLSSEDLAVRVPDGRTVYPDPQQPEFGTGEGTTDVGLGLQIGLGLNLPLDDRFSLFGEANYNAVLADRNAQYLALRGGVAVILFD